MPTVNNIFSPIDYTIKHLDLGRQLNNIRPEIDTTIQSVLDRTAFVGGEIVSNFETQFADFCNTSFCIGVGNGTDALYLTFLALGLKPGDEVITTTMSFIATIEPLIQLGIKPILVDIEPDTYNLHPDQVEQAITEKTKAILPVHLYGQPASMDKLKPLAEKYNLLVIEDCAQSHGAVIDGQTIGSIGQIGTFSFYPGKNLGAFGDGGAVVTNDETLAKKVRMISNHGRKEKYEHEIFGINSRLDTLQAAILYTIHVDYFTVRNGIKY